MDLSISGLASGMDWKTLVSQLADAERAPEKELQNEQNTLRQQNNAYASIQTQLTTLSSRVTALKDPTLFQSRQTQVSDATIASATAAAGTSTGSYKFSVTQMASAALQYGKGNTGKPLSTTDQVSNVILGSAGFSTSISDGTFTINGTKITVARTDSLQDIFDRIASETNGAVKASYDPANDKMVLDSDGEIVLGSAADTSNFLQVAKLYNSPYTSGRQTLSSTASLGGINQTATLEEANFAKTIEDDGNGAGEFLINGVSIAFSATSDNLVNLIDRINNSTAGVTASYDSTNDRMVLTNKSTGDVGISLEDVSGNFLSASGLTDGKLQHGANLTYTVNDGGTLTSQSNSITEASSGIAGLSVNVLTKGTVNVSVSSDTTALKKAINDFVTEFNSVQSVIDTNTTSSTDSTGVVTAGVLASDGEADGIGATLRHLAYARDVNSTTLVKSLDDLGISTSGNNNNLVVDDTKLTAALSGNLSSIKDLFTNPTTGLAVTLSGYLDKTIGDDGTLVAKQSSVTKQITDIDTQVANMEKQITTDSDALTAEFVTMETAQANAKQQLQYLQQTFGGSSSSSSSNSSKS